MRSRYEFSETRKVLEEFFKAEEEFPLPSDQGQQVNHFRGKFYISFFYIKVENIVLSENFKPRNPIFFVLIKF